MKFFFAFISILFSLNLYAQTPGGVSNTDMYLWFKGDDLGIETAPSPDDFEWPDGSGKGNFAFQEEDDPRPTQTNFFNYNETYSFDGIEDYLAIKALNYTANEEIDNLYGFVVYSSDFSGGNNDNNSFIGFGRTTGYSMSLRGNGRLSLQFRDVDNSTNETLQNGTASNANDGNPHIAGFIFETLNTNDSQIRFDGRLDVEGDKLTGDLKIRSNRYGFIGDDSSTNTENGTNTGNYFQGDIAEIILYNQSTAMAATDITKIETHLALKYGITLDNSAEGTAGDYIDGDDNIIWDASANADYHHNVGGIINDTYGDLHQKISNPLNSQLTISTVNNYTLANSDTGTRTNVTNDTYLLFGDNASALGFETCGVSDKIILKRKWFFVESSTETNDVYVAVSEDIFPAGATVTMIISTDDTFDGTDTTVAMTNSGGVYKTSSSVDIDDNDRVSFLIDETKIAGVSIGKLDLHLSAAENTLVDDVLTLEDLSNGYANAVQDVVSNTPDSATDFMNFNPTLTFDGDDYLYIQNKFYDVDDEIPYLHTFIVFSTDYNDGGARTNTSFIDFDRIGAHATYIRGDGKLATQYRSSGSNLTETGVGVLNDGLPHIAESVFSSTAVGDDTFVKYDGYIDDSSEKIAGNIIIDKKRYGIIGDESNDDIENGTTRGVYFNGQISEIILTDTEEFTSNEIIQIESYLALKYGVTLDSGIATYKNSEGTTVWDNTSYWNGIAGIIKDEEDTGTLDQRIAQSTSAKDIILATPSIATPLVPDFTASNSDADRSALNEESYLLFGNNGGTAGAIEENLALSKSVTTRHWLFKEGGTNLNDNVFVAIPKSYFPEGTTGVIAYISSDDTFDGSDTSVSLTDDGTYYYFSRDIDDGDRLAYAVDIPTAVGPGNVIDGLTMWIKTDDVITSAGSYVNSVVDHTFNGNNLSQSDNTRKPIINLSETNYNPAITFTSDRLAIENLNYSIAGAINKVYAWVVYSTDYFASNTNAGIDDKNNAFISFDRRRFFAMHVRGDGKLSLTYEDSSDNRENAIGTAITNTGTTQLGGFIFDNSLTDETILRHNGEVDFEDDLTTLNIGTNNSVQTRYGYVGDGSNASSFDSNPRSNYYEGSISEIVYYEGETLATDEVTKIETYLAIKYGITLSGNYVDSNDTTIWNATTNAGYNNDIAVIGQDDDSELDQKQSKSENSDGVLTISIHTSIATSNEDNTGAFDQNYDFLAWGNNSSDEAFIVDCSASTLKVNKEWKVQNTGSVGAVTMQFDMSTIPDPGSFELILDDDGDFSTTGDQTTETGSLSGTDLTFSSVTLDDGVYFTLMKSAASNIVYDGSWSGGSGAGGAPDDTDIGKKVTIESSVEITDSFNCNCLEIDASQVLTVPTGKYVCANEITLHGDIYLEGTAELVQTDDNTNNSGSGELYKIVGEATDSPYRYNFFSSPVNTSGTFSITNNFKFNTGATLANNTDPSFTNSVDGSSNTISRQWLYVLNNGTDFSDITENTSLDPGVGFTMKGTGTTNDYNFIGIPNNGEINVEVDEDNYLLTGNPYPSTINIDTFNAQMLADGITDGTVYLWDQPEGDAHAVGSDNIGGYATRINEVGTIAVTVDDSAITGATEPTEFIKPGQGFVVNGTTDDVNVQFTNALRSGIDYATEASTSHFFKTTKATTIQSPINQRAVVHVGFEYKKDNGKVFHRQLATVLEYENLLDKEVGKDAYMFDYFENDAYWVLPNEEDRFVITGVPSLLDDEDLELPIGVVLDVDREITFKLDKVENLSKVYLLDRETNTISNIIKNEYSTFVNAGDNIDRFSLVFKDHNHLDTEEEEELLTIDTVDNKYEMYVSTEDKNLHIKVTNTNIKEIRLYDFTGRLLINHVEKNKKNEVNLSTDGIASNVYILKVLTDKTIFSKRIIIKESFKD